MPLQSLSAGRILMILGNLSYSLGAFLADYNETHVLNPRWPPHAKFHNGQTMSLGLCLAAMSLYLAFRPEARPSQVRDNLFNAALLGSFYCGAGLCAILYPGTAWQDPEFEGNGEQRYIFVAVCVLMAVGYWIDASKLTNEKPA